MGTNYYLQRKVNQDGRRHDLHICKTSGGWYPHLQGYVNSYDSKIIKSWFEWKLYLRAEIERNEGLIFNEYDELMALEDFIDLIESWQKTAIKENYSNPFNSDPRDRFNSSIPSDFMRDLEDTITKEAWLDPEGYWISTRDFS